jgi:hypothetical protein
MNDRVREIIQDRLKEHRNELLEKFGRIEAELRKMNQALDRLGAKKRPENEALRHSRKRKQRIEASLDEKAHPRRSVVCEKVLDYLRAHREGATAAGIASAIGHPIWPVRSVLSYLHRLGLVMDSGRRGEGARGRRVIVWWSSKGISAPLMRGVRVVGSRAQEMAPSCPRREAENNVIPFPGPRRIVQEDEGPKAS